MRKGLVILLALSLILFSVTIVRGQDLGLIKGEITSPNDGEAIRGIVLISGSTLADELIFWELSYGYVDDTTGTWFLISEGDQPIETNLFAEWDTTQVTDGNYNLRLTLYLEENRRSHTIIKNLRLRNYTPIETDTPNAVQTSTPIIDQKFDKDQTPTPLVITNELTPTPTPIPTNSLEIHPSELSNSMIRGAAGVLVLFILIGLYSTLRKSMGN